MRYYQLVKLPSDLSNVESFSFTQEQLQENKLWQIKDTPYFLHTYKNALNSIDGTLRKINKIDFRFPSFTQNQLEIIAKHFLQKGAVSYIRFIGEDMEESTWQENYKYLSKLRWKVFTQTETEEDIQEALKELEKILYEECLVIETIYMVFQANGTRVEVPLFATLSSFLSDTSVSILEEQQILDFYLQLLSLLLGADLTLEEIKLKGQNIVEYPLKKQPELVKYLIEIGGEKAKKDLNLTEEEWLLLTKDLICYANQKKDIKKLVITKR